MLPDDEHRREVEYALEYAMLAILDRMPPVVPPPQTLSEAHQRLRGYCSRHNTPPVPIRVPRDWKPCLELPKHMLDSQAQPQLDKQIEQLRGLITNAIFTGRSNSYLATAHNYLATAKIYVRRAHFEQARVDRKRKSDELAESMDEWYANKKR
ncbi:hypothetical protein ABFS82_12G024100 [Erythranthe guttata]|uniref:Uncharacterized protein n=1 Tax=Erythranthe guttata TaxID=4155 RepID=A0A022RNH3_ERYGU|nr:PREDICTED: uncharacterized protein LOC105953492 [Erythranthe guttata]EYU41353.1 hypothetical protein MIMGU_mgv1a015604mg [Erythranthe guttata]|eukprot:XP_012832611.1 PREDICTED: uncharacterized protein LOC105953492 [Erythranthe guttata]